MAASFALPSGDSALALNTLTNKLNDLADRIAQGTFELHTVGGYAGLARTLAHNWKACHDKGSKGSEVSPWPGLSCAVLSVIGALAHGSEDVAAAMLRSHAETAALMGALVAACASGRHAPAVVATGAGMLCLFQLANPSQDGSTPLFLAAAHGALSCLPEGGASGDLYHHGASWAAHCEALAAGAWLLDRTVRRAGASQSCALFVDAMTRAPPGAAWVAWPLSLSRALLHPYITAGRDTLTGPQPTDANGQRLLDVILPPTVASIGVRPELAWECGRLLCIDAPGLQVLLLLLSSGSAACVSQGITIAAAMARLAGAAVAGPACPTPISRKQAQEAMETAVRSVAVTDLVLNPLPDLYAALRTRLADALWGHPSSGGGTRQPTLLELLVAAVLLCPCVTSAHPPVPGAQLAALAFLRDAAAAVGTGVYSVGGSSGGTPAKSPIETFTFFHAAVASVTAPYAALTVDRGSSGMDVEGDEGEAAEVSGAARARRAQYADQVHSVAVHSLISIHRSLTLLLGREEPRSSRSSPSSSSSSSSSSAAREPGGGSGTIPRRTSAVEFARVATSTFLAMLDAELLAFYSARPGQGRLVTIVTLLNSLQLPSTPEFIAHARASVTGGPPQQPARHASTLLFHSAFILLNTLPSMPRHSGRGLPIALLQGMCEAGVPVLTPAAGPLRGEGWGGSKQDTGTAEACADASFNLVDTSILAVSRVCETVRRGRPGQVVDADIATLSRDVVQAWISLRMTLSAVFLPGTPSRADAVLRVKEVLELYPSILPAKEVGREGKGGGGPSGGAAPDAHRREEMVHSALESATSQGRSEREMRAAQGRSEREMRAAQGAKGGGESRGAREEHTELGLTQRVDRLFHPTPTPPALFHPTPTPPALFHPTPTPPAEGGRAHAPPPAVEASVPAGTKRKAEALGADARHGESGARVPRTDALAPVMKAAEAPGPLLHPPGPSSVKPREIKQTQNPYRAVQLSIGAEDSEDEMEEEEEEGAGKGGGARGGGHGVG